MPSAASTRRSPFSSRIETRPRFAPWWRARISRTRCSDALRFSVPDSAWLTSRSVARRRVSRAGASTSGDVPVVVGFNTDILVAIRRSRNPAPRQGIRQFCWTSDPVLHGCLNQHRRRACIAENTPDFARTAATRRGLHLARQPRMLRPAALLTLMVPLMTASTPARADDLPPAVHVRPFDADARALVDEAAARSPAIRELVDRLEQSDLVVYIRFSVFHNSQFTGRI